MKKFYFTLIFMSGVVSGKVSAQEATRTFRYQVGNYEVYTLNETESRGNQGILLYTTPEMIRETLPEGSYPNAVNAFLVKTPQKNSLIDTGYGTRLIANLGVAGITPEDIHEVLLTHMHGDHIGGLLKDEKVVFPNATLKVSAAEHNYWTSDEAMEQLPENARKGFTGARQVLDQYGSELVDPESLRKAVEREEEGIFPIEAYGHTPGHIGFLLVSKGDKLFIWGDLTHAIAIQMPYPGVATTYDVDPDMAVTSRIGLLRYLSDHNIPVAGMHVPFPAIGEVESTGIERYRFIPAE